MPAAGQANAVAVTQAQVQALLPEAIAAWQAAGLDAADVRRLEGVQVQVGNLGTSILGLEAAGVITINQTAAGYNWYVNASTARARRSAWPARQARLAGPGSPAAGEVDLLTVLEHELGHVIGLSDNNQAGDLMDITLGLGVRRAPTAADVTTTIRTLSTINSLASKATLDAALDSFATDSISLKYQTTGQSFPGQSRISPRSVISPPFRAARPAELASRPLLFNRHLTTDYLPSSNGNNPSRLLGIDSSSFLPLPIAAAARLYRCCVSTLSAGSYREYACRE